MKERDASSAVEDSQNNANGDDWGANGRKCSFSTQFVFITRWDAFKGFHVLPLVSLFV